MIENTCMYTVSILYIVLYIHVHPEFGGTFPVSSYVFYRRAIVFCPCCSYSQLKPVWLTSFKPVALLGVWSEAQKRIPHWVWAPLLPGSDGSVEFDPIENRHQLAFEGPFTTEPWLLKANLGCLEVNFFDYVDSAIDVCLSLDVICSLISIGSHGSLVPSIAGLP